jgi:putative ABC transport system substrate-binding protein
MTAPRILVIGPVPATREVEQLVAALSAGLRDLGYVPGRSLELVYRGYTDDRHDPLLNLASEIDALRPAVVVAWGAACARAYGVVHHPPVVFVINADPIAVNLTASRTRSGLTTWAPGCVEKQLGILNTLVPGVRRVAILWDPSDGGSIRAFNETAESSRSFGLRRESMELRARTDLERAFAEAVDRDVDAVCLVWSPALAVQGAHIARLANRYRVPLIADVAEFADAGGLAAYGASLPTAFRRSARYADRMLKTARADALPVERVRPKLVLNMRTAASLGITIPASLLAQADRRLE